MSVVPGTRIGPYEIVSALGAGGMGEVYRARDDRLDRDVAIKILPASFSIDPDRVARFTREAKTLAALNHPRIAQVYDTGTAGSTTYLVMELVEGADLTQLIAHGPVPVGDALPIAREIAEAVEAAHERGVIHRDLKPGNVKLTSDGHVKVLDFGLAKAIASDRDDAVSLANSPTLTARATEAGLILGTAAYMSPEQARGRVVDKRTDIWAFGAVLYELLTGRRAFDGETVSDTLAAVLRADPDWTALPADTPPHVTALLRRCLERDQSRRLRDIGEARLALETGQSPPTTSLTSTGAAPAAAELAPAPVRWPWIAATIVLAALAIVAAYRGRPRPAASAFELAIAPPVGAEFSIGSNSGNVILSPDGTSIAFVATTPQATQLWVRSLAQNDAKPLPGTDGVSYPFWSADGRRIAFFADGKLKTIEIAGGLPVVIADAENGRGGSWSEDGTIIFTGKGGGTISRVAAAGGPATPLTKLDFSRGENAHYWPTFLPGGSQFLYFVRSTNPENGGIYLAPLDGSRPAVRLVASLSAGVPIVRPSTGQLFLLWARDHDLLAQPLDPTHATLRGDAVVVGHDVRVDESQRLAFVGASRTGVLAWASARAAEYQLAHLDRAGRRLTPIDIPPGALFGPALSPDGRQLLFTRVERGNGDVFLYDMSTRVTRRLTTSPDYDEQPVWIADGRAFLYLASENGRINLRRITLPEGENSEALADFTGLTVAGVPPDGRRLVVSSTNPKGGTDFLAYGSGGASKPILMATVPELAAISSITTDGHWLLLDYRQSGAIARLHMDGATPSIGARIPIAGGSMAQLRADGREAYVVTPDGTVKAIAITPGDETASPGAATTLFTLSTYVGGFSANAAGTEFILVDAPFQTGQTITVLTDWETRLQGIR